MSLLEAMSYGNCCLTSDIPECTEVVESHGIAFSQSVIPQLAKALQQLCDEPEIVRQYKESASDFICSKYNWDDVTKRTLELYQ